MLSRLSLVLISLIVAALSIANWLWSAPPSTRPVDGLRENAPDVFALTGARVVVSPGRTLDSANVLIREGVIVAVGGDVPAGARVIDLKGKTIYPGLIDAYSEVELDAAGLGKGAPYWNSEVRPQLNVAEQFTADSELNKKLRSQGVVAQLVAPRSGVIKGTSAFVSTADGGSDRTILKKIVAQHLRLTVSPGRGRNDFPNSPMGAVALARQSFYDAEWYDKAWTAHRADRSRARPEQNDALTALGQWRSGEELLIVDTSNEQFILRADRFAHEFGLNIAVLGSGNEYRRIDEVHQTGRTIIVPVEFPKPPNVATPESAIDVSLESLMHWDIAPENPGRVDRAGIPFALTSQGLKDRGTFLAAVRKAVESGLAPDSALRALTETPARLFGVADRLGSVEAGKAASLIVTDGELFAKETKIIETWIDGQRFEITPAPSFDVRGNWLAKIQGEKSPLTLLLEGEPNKLAGSIRAAKSKPEEAIKLEHIGMRGGRLNAIFKSDKFGHPGSSQLSVLLEKSDANESLTGFVIWPNGKQAELVASRAPASKEKPAGDAPKKNTDQKPDDKTKPDEKKPVNALFAVNFPMGDFGVASAPEQPAAIMFKGATIWTCGPDGVIENGSMLVRRGKIVAVGKDLEAPADARIIDVSGRHVSPGIIDCHSHMATDGGINEATQAITAEVRIGDFIDADDIAIYQQLAGGVTCANVLHGSANPIGGQNQVIKFRWGATGEALKFKRAPQGIKFALGENVKQSNWGNEFTTRYPQTRMGVEQIIRDEFEAARAYQAKWDEWNRDHRGLPPRRDLELDAISEILRGERWIHCHSYRQDEILALIRVLDEYKVTIGSFQHILEGYKVADAMARHGATGSSFSDWWAYKFEVYDAIPYNGALMHHAGVNVSFNSDDRELARHLNHEAAKAVKYGGVDPAEALKFVTLNPAIQLRIDDYVGSLEAGKDADFVIWSGSPLSIISRCQQTWVDGRKYFDLTDDARRRDESRQMRTTLIQKILSSGETMEKPGEGDKDPASLWPREDIFCHDHGHDHQ